MSEEMRVKILITGRDTTLLYTRECLLNTKYDVTTTEPQWLLNQLDRYPFRLLLVCSSIPSEEAAGLIDVTRARYPELCIVRLVSFEDAATPGTGPHRAVVIDFHPDAWINVIEELVTSPVRETFQKLSRRP